LSQAPCTGNDSEKMAKSCILMIIYIGNVILAKKLATATDIDNKVTEYVLAFATLGDATRNRNNPICVTQPKVAKASTIVSVTCRCRWHYHDKLCQYKHSLRLI